MLKTENHLDFYSRVPTVRDGMLHSEKHDDAEDFLFFVEAITSSMSPCSYPTRREPFYKSYTNFHDPRFAMPINPHRLLLGQDYQASHYDSNSNNINKLEAYVQKVPILNESNLLSYNRITPPENESALKENVMAKADEGFVEERNDRKFKCGTCGKQFKRRSSLSTHKLIHANVKPFQCTECSKDFLRRSDLKKHQLMHSGQKPHQCSKCGKVFSQSSNMLTHMRRHSGVRPFSCQICGHAFYRKVDVRRHQSRHEKEKELERQEQEEAQPSPFQ